MKVTDTLIAFDESGYTGSDFLHKDQPVFVLSSVRMTSKEALTLYDIFKTDALELKFSRIKKYPKYQKALVEFLNHDLITKDTVNIFVAHKEYLIIAHTVDRLIEPLAYKDGHDLYADGFNIAITNFLFYCIPIYCDVKIYEEYKIAFIQMFKERSGNSINSFYSVVQRLLESCTNETFRKTLAIILASSQVIKKELQGLDAYSLDVTLSAFIQQIDYWGRKSSKSFDVYMDESKPIRHFQSLIDQVKRIWKAQEIGTDRRTLQLPLKLKRLNFVDSVQYEVVQIADIIAGASNHYHKSLIRGAQIDELAKMIADTKLVELGVDGVWPELKVTPKDLGTEGTGKNLLDGLIDAYQIH